MLKDDLAWRVLTVGEMDDYKLIQKLSQHKADISFIAFYGFQFKKSGKPIWKNINYYDKDCIDHFILKNPKRIGRNGQSIRRKGKFSPKQLLVKRFVEKDLRVKAAYDHEGYRFQENLIGVQTDTHDYRLLLAFLNSSLMSYILFYNSAQIGKGTYNMLQLNDIQSAPIRSIGDIPSNIKSKLIKIYDRIQSITKIPPDVFEEIDEIIFNIYHLKDFEKQRIRDFFYIHVRKSIKDGLVTNEDFNAYANRFRKVFMFILQDDKFLNAEAFFSSMQGAGITFTIAGPELYADNVSIYHDSNLARIVTYVAKRGLKKAEKIRVLKQEKLKLYNKNSFTILKSNYYKDWTETEAIKDAKEEIGLFIKYLPEE